MVGLDRATGHRGPSAAPPVIVRVLGAFDVVAGGRPLRRADWQRMSAERLFKLLLVTPGHRLLREVAAETLWPDREPGSTGTNLRKAIHFAHRALAGTGLLLAEGGTVRLESRNLDLDLDRLEAAYELL